jgi:hypothetical protein
LRAFLAFVIGSALVASAHAQTAESAGGLASPARALPLELTWSAPPGCPDEAAVRAELARALVVRESVVLQTLHARGEVRRDGARFVLVLDTRLGGVSGSRRVYARECRDLARAATLVLALAYGGGVEVRSENDSADPVAASAVGGSTAEGVGTETETETGTGTGTETGTEAETETETEAETETETEAETETETSDTDTDTDSDSDSDSDTTFDVALSLALDTGLLPAPSLAPGLALGVAGARWRVRALASFGLPRTDTIDPDAMDPAARDVRAHYRASSVGAQLCVASRPRTLRVEACVGGLARFVRAEGEGTDDDRVARAPFASAQLELAAIARLGRGFELRPSLSFGAQPHRPRFTIDARVVHRVEAFSFGAALAIGWRSR